MDIIMATSQNLANVKWLTIDQLDFSEGSDDVVTEIAGELCIGELCDGGMNCSYPEPYFVALSPIQKFCKLRDYIHWMVGGVPRTRDMLWTMSSVEPETGLEMFLQRWCEEEEAILLPGEEWEPHCFFLVDWLGADLYDGIGGNAACEELLCVCQDVVGMNVHYVEETQQLKLRTWKRRPGEDHRKTNIPPYWWLKQEGYVE
jgi:hypothetical protein